MKNPNINTFLNDESHQTFEKILINKLKLLHNEKKNLLHNIKETEQENNNEKSKKKAYLEKILLEIASNREESLELRQSIKELTDLIQQYDDETSELKKKFMGIHTDNPSKLLLIEKAENLNKLKKENMEIKEKMVNASKINNEQYSILKNHFDEVIEEYLTHIFKLENLNRQYKQENIDLKIINLTLMKEHISQSKQLYQRQSIIQNLTEDLKTLQKNNANFLNKNYRSNSDSNHKVIYQSNKKNQNPCTYFDEISTHLTTPESILNPTITQTNSIKTKKSGNNANNTLNNTNNSSLFKLNFNSNHSIQNLQPPLILSTRKKSPKDVGLKRQYSTKSINSRRYNESSSNNINSNNNNNNENVCMMNFNHIGQNEKDTISKKASQNTNSELKFIPISNNPNSKEKMFNTTSKYPKKSDYLRINDIKDFTNNSDELKYQCNSGYDLSQRQSSQRIKNDELYCKDIDNIQNNNGLELENQNHNWQINIGSPDYILGVSSSILTSNWNKDELLNESNGSYETPNSDKLIESVNKICTEEKDRFESLGKSYSPIHPFFKSKTFDMPMIDSLCDLPVKLDVNLTSPKSSNNFKNNKSSEEKNPLETEPDDNSESQLGSPEISQKGKSFYSTVPLNHKPKNCLSSNSNQIKIC